VGSTAQVRGFKAPYFLLANIVLKNYLYPPFQDSFFLPEKIFLPMHKKFGKYFLNFFKCKILFQQYKNSENMFQTFLARAKKFF
jgi:hypothetical protein